MSLSRILEELLPHQVNFGESVALSTQEGPIIHSVCCQVLNDRGNLIFVGPHGCHFSPLPRAAAHSGCCEASTAPVTPLNIPLWGLPQPFLSVPRAVLHPVTSISETVSWGILLMEYLKNKKQQQQTDEAGKQKHCSRRICQLCTILKGCYTLNYPVIGLQIYTVCATAS